MITVPFLLRLREPVRCTIEIEHSEASLHAHLDLDGRPALQPGDRVKVHGDWLERQWTRLAGRSILNELYDVSFSSGSLS